VLSTQSLIDLYAASFDATDPDALGGTEAWQIRLAFIGKDVDTRVSAMRSIWGNAQSPLDRVAAQVLTARAARHIARTANCSRTHLIWSRRCWPVGLTVRRPAGPYPRRHG
jgi:hypothetical protein